MRRWLVLGLLCLPGLAQAQTDDRSYLTALLEDSFSGEGRRVVITGFQGALSSQASLTELTIADADGVWLTLTDVALDWNRAALLSGRVEVTSLTAASIVLDRLPASGDSGPAPEARGFAMPELPVSVEIGSIVANQIVLGPTILGEAVEASIEASLSVSGGQGEASLLLLRTDGATDGRLTLEASYANGSGQLDLNLTAEEGPGGVAVRLLGVPGAPDAVLTVIGSGPVTDFGAGIELQTDGRTRLAGDLRLTGDGSGQTGFAGDLAGDLAPLFLPQYAEFLGPLVRLTVAGERSALGRIDLSDLTLSARALNVSGSLLLSADGLPERFDLQGRVGLNDEPVLVPLGGAGETRLTSADIALRFDSAQGEGWTGEALVLGLDRDDINADRLELTGSGRIARLTEGPLVSASLRFAATGLLPADAGLATALGSDVTGQMLAEWQAGRGGLTISDLQIAGQDYAASAAGLIAGLEQGFALSGRVDAQMTDLSRLAGLVGQPVAGRGDVTLTGTGSPLSGQFDVETVISGTDLRVGVVELDRLLSGSSRIEAAVRRDETGTTLRAARVEAATLTVTAQGQLATDGSDLTADLDFADLSVLGSEYRGALQGKARLTGTLPTAMLELTATGRDLGIGQPQADAVLRGETALTVLVQLQGDGLRIDRADVRSAQGSLKATGTLAPSGSDVAADLTLANLAVIGGGYGGSLTGTAQFTGQMQAGRIVLEATGDALTIGQPEADRLLRGQSRVLATLVLDEAGIGIEQAEIANPQVTASATGRLNGAARQIDLTARLANLALVLPDFPGPLTVTGTAVQDASGIYLNLRGTGPGQIDAAVSGRLASDLRSADLAITGAAQAALANVFIDPQAVSGAVRFDLRLNGPLAVSSLSGPVTVTGGRVADPAQNFALQAVEARADLSGGQARLAVAASVSSGGNVRLDGSVGLAAPFDADLAVTLQQVTLRDPDLYETTANGALMVTGPLTGGALIAGRVALTQTELRIPSTGVVGAGDLPGLEHVSEPAAVRQTRVRAGLTGEKAGQVAPGGGAFALDLVISAPNRVFVRGRGLDAELGGQLTLNGTTANIVPFGSFSLIRGRLDILGKRLDLSEALMQLEGALVPFIRVVASTENDGITSSVVIEGPASDPVVTFTSQPDLPQEEVLAQLLFGQVLQNLSAFQAAQLASAVATLAGRGGDGLIARLRQGIGLDNLDVKTDDSGAASLTAGKYLSEKIYTEVTVDQTGKSQVNLNLDVSSHITLRGKAASDGSTGIGVFLEKDY